MFFSAMILAIGCLVPAQEPEPWHVRNLGLVGRLFPIGNERFAFFLSPESEAGQDWNGDGDQEDLVFHVYDAQRRQVRCLGLAAWGATGGEMARVTGSVFGLPVSEQSQGGKDLNGDGDAIDIVLFAYDAASTKIINTGLAISLISLWQYPSLVSSHEGVLAFLVEEQSQGLQDLDGNGSILDQVAHFFRFDDALVVNTRLSAVYSVSHGPIMAGALREAGARDLNSDGDREDTVVFVLHLEDLTTKLFPIAAGLTILGMRQAVPYGYLSFRASELEDGRDWNGDGDQSDLVPLVYDVGPRELRNTGVDADFLDGEDDATRALLEVSESGQSGLDLNGDGDAEDLVVHLYDLSSGALTNLGFTGSWPRLSGDQVGFTLWEKRPRQRLNEDRDFEDWVFHVFDIPSGETRDLGLALTGSHGFQHFNGRFLLDVSESQQGEEDRNGDGDAFDFVATVYDGPNDEVRNLALAGAGRFASDRIFLWLDERRQAETDLNGDGDIEDNVLHVLDPRSDHLTNLEVAGTSGFIGNGVVIFEVREQEQGNQDLNGDGDALDSVLHVLEAGDLDMEKRRGPVPRR
ncbi:MAG: hypothetical protein RL885_19980 [Planctomycetota bacterium]